MDHSMDNIRLKTTVLVDNVDGVNLQGEWGLSFYIEYGDKTVLLDTGLSGLFADNAAKLGLDLGKADFAVLSHAHDDHANGLDTFFECNDHAPLYVAAGCEENCYDKVDGHYQYAGIPRGILKRHADRIIRAEDDKGSAVAGEDYTETGTAHKRGPIGGMQISEGIWLLRHTTPGLEKTGLMENMFLRLGESEYVPDDFSHEQSLIFELADGIVVFNSCSHAGADVIIKEAMEAFPGRKILAMIGGFHLFNKTDDYVREFARRVEATGVESIITGHCTGPKAMEILKNELGDKVHELKTGLVFVID